MSGKKFLGSIIVDKGLATSEDVMDCLKIQRKARQLSKKSLPLGEIMVFQGILSPAQLQEVLQEVEYETKAYTTEDVMLLSEVLLEKGFVTSKEILEALDIQWKEDFEGKAHRFLGTILKEEGHLLEEQFQEVMELYEKSGIVTVIALKDNIRFHMNTQETPQEITLSKGISYYTFSERFRTGNYGITWYVQQEKGYRGPFTVDFLLKGNTVIAPIVDEEGNGKVLYMKTS